MIDIFGNLPIDLTKITCHSGGAIGSDTYFETIGANYGVKIKAYSYKTKYHTTDNKVEISDTDYEEGVKAIQLANRSLNRYGIHRFMNLLARNWAQVKYSDEVFAIGTIVLPGKKGSKGFYNKSQLEVVDGGTGYAVQMAIDNRKTVYVFDQEKDKWFRWSYTSLSFRELKGTPVITSENFAGIGTREIKPNGILAIQEVYNLTFSK
jgi:hypothetical protein